MGTINYETSDYITLAFQEYYIDDFDKEEVIAEMIEYNGYSDREEAEADYEDYVYGLITIYEGDDYDNAKYTLKDYDFHFFDLTMQGGYYHGSQLILENNIPDEFDDLYDKRSAQKEIARLKKCLIDLAGIGMNSCYPWWVTRYDDYDGTIKAINNAINQMWEEVRKITVWREAAQRNW